MVRGDGAESHFFFMSMSLTVDIKPTTAEIHVLVTVPTGYVVKESEKAGLPLLKRG